MRTLILITLLVISFSTFSSATTIHIPDDQPTIQAGLNIATEGDTVLVAAGTYYENITWPAVNGIRLIGNGEEDCIIDGDSLASVIRFTWALGGIIDETTMISSFIIRNGNASGDAPDNRGGGIRCTFASPGLSDLIISDNLAAYRGGGLYCETNSSPTLERITFSGNVALDGGGMYIAPGCNPDLEDVTVYSNFSEDSGGGIFCNSASPTLDSVTISDNRAVNQGGGIAASYSEPGLNNVTISGNSAGSGGGIYCSGSTPMLLGTTVRNNSADYNGGGIYFDNNSGIAFSSEDRCNLYSNRISQDRGFGADLFSIECDIIDIIVDTFTVMIPTSYHASPNESYSFDILHGMDDLIEADVYVAVDGDDSNDGISPETPFRTIQHALSRIADGNTILLAAGVYSPSTTGELFPIRWSDHVDLSRSTVGEVILDAEQTARVLEFEYVTDARITNMTIMNGSAIVGGGIYCNSSDPIFLHVTISDNTAEWDGGGIYCIDSSPDLNDVTIINNSVTHFGGGLYCGENSNPMLQNVTISGNSADTGDGNHSGGGVSCRDSSPCFVDVMISGNTSGYVGGGVFLDSSSASFLDVVIQNNTGSSWGGGIYMIDSSPSLERVTINHCQTYWGGGGICIYSNSSPSLMEVTINGNTSWESGGGIYCWSSSLSLAGGTITNNVSHWSGGGISLASTSVSLLNVLISGNSADVYGGGIRCGSSPDLSLVNVTICNNIAHGVSGGGIHISYESHPVLENCILWENAPQAVSFHEYQYPGFITISCSDIEGGEEGIETNDNGEVYWLENNIDADPLFCDPIEENYRLQLDSPCRTDVCGFMGYTGETCEGEDIEDMTVVPTEFYLSQNYPNPFNPTTTIEFSLPYTQDIQLTVDNVLGQQVATLVDGICAAGIHRVMFDGSGLSSGIYIYRLTAGDDIVSGKMVLVR